MSVLDAAGRPILPEDIVVFFKFRSGTIWGTVRKVYAVDEKLGVKLYQDPSASKWNYTTGEAVKNDGSKPSIQWAQGSKMVVI
jgi:hypothetical protein